jgi:hypothetical protein
MTSEVKYETLAPCFLTSRVMDFHRARRKLSANRRGLLAFSNLRSRDWRGTMLDAQMLADRYVAAWNEQDATRRLEAIAALWAPDAQTPGGAGGRRGFGALGRLTFGSSEKNGVRFRAAPTARRRGDVVTFRWEMLLAGSETVLASGLEFLIVDDEGQILVDHPFVPA